MTPFFDTNIVVYAFLDVAKRVYQLDLLNFGKSEVLLDASPKSPINPSPSCPTEGRIRIVRDAGRDAVDAAASGVKRDAGRV